jgi:hypothetical protein
MVDITHTVIGIVLIIIVITTILTTALHTTLAGILDILHGIMEAIIILGTDTLHLTITVLMGTMDITMIMLMEEEPPEDIQTIIRYLLDIHQEIKLET